MRGLKTIPVLALALAAATGTAEAQRRTANARGVTTVILVRHAEKATGNPLDSNPPLTEAGQRRAQALAELLRRRHVDAILTTDLARTRDTAAPLARALGLRAGETHMGRDSDVVAQLVADSILTHHRGQTVLVVGHTTTVPRIIALLGGQRLGDLCESAYSNVFTVTLRRDRAAEVAQAHYGAADPADDECVNGIHVEKHHGH